MKNGVSSAGRAQISERTLRTDRWWLQPAITMTVLLSFVVYSTWRAFENAHYYAKPLLSPFYSPCLATSCVDGSSDFGTPFGSWWILSPALETRCGRRRPSWTGGSRVDFPRARSLHNFSSRDTSNCDSPPSR